MTHVSLFSGIGGIDLAAEWAGSSSSREGLPMAEQVTPRVDESRGIFDKLVFEKQPEDPVTSDPEVRRRWKEKVLRGASELRPSPTCKD